MLEVSLLADVDEVKQGLAESLKESKKEIERVMADLIDSSEKAVNASNKRQMKKYIKMREKQQEDLDDLMSDFEATFDAAGDCLSDLDADLYETFLGKRQKDLKVYNTAYSKSIKKQTEAMEGFFDSFGSQLDGLKEELGSLTDVYSALNISSIKDSLEGGSQDTIDYLRSIQKGLNMSNSEFKDFKKNEFKVAAKELKKEYGGMVSGSDLASAVDFVINDITVKDTARATEYGKALAEYSVSTGLEKDNIDDIVKAIDTYGWSTDTLGELTGTMKAWSQKYEVNDETLSGILEATTGRNEMLANGDENRYKELQMQAMQAATLLENSYIDSSKVMDSFMSANNAGELASKYSWLAASGVDVGEMYNDIQNGMYSEASAAFMEGIGNLKASGQLDNPQMRAMIAESLDMTEAELMKISNNYTSEYVDEMDKYADSIKADPQEYLEKSINDATYKKWYQKLADKFGMSGLGMSVTNFIDGIDFDLADVLMLDKGWEIFKSIKAGGGLFGKIGPKLGKLFKKPKFIADFGDDFLKVFKGGVKSGAKGIKTVGSKIGGKALGGIASGLGFIIDGIGGLKKAKEWGTGKGSGILGGLLGGSGDGWGGEGTIGEKIGDSLGGALKWGAVGTAILPGIGILVGGVFGLITSAIGGSKFAKVFDDIGDWFVKAGETVGDKLEEAGDWIAEKWEGFWSWFKGGDKKKKAKRVADTGNGTYGNYGVGGMNNIPGHKDGLGYVPYDDYVARLHKGERVLTAEENANYSGSNLVGIKRALTEVLLDKDVIKKFTEGISGRLNKISNRQNAAITNTQIGSSGGSTGGLGGAISNFLRGGSNTSGGGSTGASASTGAIEDGGNNEKTIWNYLTKNMGLNKAGAAGVLSNIFSESSFNPNCIGDGGTSYGICQWHNERWTALKKFCSANGLDWQSLEGQLRYLESELKRSYSGVYNKITTVSNDAQGAYDAAYKWCVDFEVPSDKFNVAQRRATTAKQYYQKYASYDVGTPWVPNDQLAMVHKGEMIVPAKYNPINAPESSSSNLSLEEVIAVLKNGFQFLGKKIEDLEIKVNTVVDGGTKESQAPYYMTSYRGGVG